MKILIDFDGTIHETTKGIVECCREDNPSLLIPKYGETLLTWDFKNYNLPKEFFKYFGSERAYKKEYIIKDCIESLKELCKQGHELYVCTRTNFGIDMKVQFIKEHLPMVKGTIIVATDDFEDKCLVSNTEDTIMIDDRMDCFEGSNRHNILFGEYDWNKEYRDNKELTFAPDWKSVINIIKTI